MKTKKELSSFEETLAMQRQQDSSHRFTLEIGLFVALLFGSFMVMVNDLGYNTLFLDEAINVAIGEDFLQGDYSRNAMAFHFGSYLYPAVSASMNKIGGIAAMRFMSTLMMCLATVFVYLSARNIFGFKAGLFSLLLFAFSGIILNLGQLAVYDSLALPFLAASLFFLITASTSENHRISYLLASSASAIFATLSKYIGLIYLPALFMTAFVLFWLKGTTIRNTLNLLFKYFLLPIILILSYYTVFYWRDLTRVFQEQGFSPASRGSILGIIGQEIGIVLLLAVAGFAWLIITVTQNQNPDTKLLHLNEGTKLHWDALPQTKRISLFVILLLLLCTWLAAPLQQWLTANSRSLWKNCAYSLIFLAPLAGFFLATVIEQLRTRNFVINVISLVLFCAGILYYANRSLDANWAFHGSWPNTTGALTYLQNADLDENSRVLAEGMDIYEYYHAAENGNRPVWDNFWYMEYKGAVGQEAVRAAIQDHAFDFIIVEDYYLPGIRERINPILAESGYIVGWQDTQTLRTGETILLQIFVLTST
jgi:hypothetical protein